MKAWLRVIRVLACAALAVLLLSATPASAEVFVLPRTPVRGLDVSSYQHHGAPINWRLLVRRGIRFVAVKVSEGTYYKNPYYAADARGAAAAGLAVMPYVFANPRRAGGAATARFAVAAARYRRGRTALPIGVDLEDNPYAAAEHTGDCYNLRGRRMIAWIAAFEAKAEALTGKRPVIYTTAAWWRECTRNTARFKKDPLWVAAYDTRVPGVPSPWTQWTFWQYADNAKLAGVGVTDVDYFHPTPDLPALAGLPARRPAKRPARRPRTKPSPAPRHQATPAPVSTSWIPPYKLDG